jgi:hypothetical protein
VENEKIIQLIVAAIVGAIIKQTASGLIKSTAKTATKAKNKFKLWLGMNRELGSLIWESFWLILIYLFFFAVPTDGKLTSASVHLIAMLATMSLAQTVLVCLALRDYLDFRKKLKNN